MKRSFKKLFVTLTAITTMAVGMSGIHVSAQTYQEKTVTTRNGSRSISVHNYVYRDVYNPPSSGISVYTSGVGASTIGGYLTNFSGGGYLYTSTTTTPISGSDSNISSYTVSNSGSGVGYYYTTYALNMNTSSSSYGTSNYTANGAF